MVAAYTAAKRPYYFCAPPICAATRMLGYRYAPGECTGEVVKMHTARSVFTPGLRAMTKPKLEGR
ncbi:hypothetical protein KCP69_18675 [Salmonella enterica subsp. enterica]|nr:hypothetical protein KCP69_18675 [Salmonella enterica subsp. enterica]